MAEWSLWNYPFALAGHSAQAHEGVAGKPGEKTGINVCHELHELTGVC
jgi:hypothetical protein